MPFALLFVGAVLLVAAVRGQTTQLFGLVKNDFTGKDNYMYWMASILIIGALGYFKPIAPLSRAFMGLLVIVLVLTNGGLFSKLNQQLFSGSLTAGLSPNLGGGLGLLNPQQSSIQSGSQPSMGGVYNTLTSPLVP